MAALWTTAGLVLSCTALFAGTHSHSQEKVIWRSTLLDKCGQGTNVSEKTVAACKECISNFSLPEKLTRTEARLVKRECIPKRDFKDLTKDKCAELSMNKTLLEACQKCVDDYVLSEVATRREMSAMKKACLPKLETKDRVKKKCSERAKDESQEEMCKKCVDDYQLPVNATRGEIGHLKSVCLPKIDPKTKANKKCYNRLETQADVATCQDCVENYNLPEKASCDEIKDMEKYCLFMATRQSRGEDDSLPYEDDEFENGIDE